MLSVILANFTHCAHHAFMVDVTFARTQIFQVLSCHHNL